MSTKCRAPRARTPIGWFAFLAAFLFIAAPASAQTASDSAAAQPSAASKPSTKRLGARTLREGMRGTDVEDVQGLLARLGFDVTVDGEYGPNTTAAVEEFEKADRLRVDGVVVRRDARRMKRAAVVNAAGATGGAEAETPLAPPDPESEGGEVPATAPGDKATVTPDGLAAAPASAPQAVKDIIAAGNKIAKLPYRYGGGHASFLDTAYDCSGSVSFALKGADLVSSPMPSGPFGSWGEPGPGQWVTTYSHSGHIYAVIAGLRFDTSGRAQTGSRWQTEQRSPAGFTARHPNGL